MHTQRLAAFASVALAIAAPHAVAAPTIAHGAIVDADTSPSDVSMAASAPLPFGVTLTAPSPFDASAVEDTTLHRIAGREDVNQHAYSEQVAGVTKNTIGDNAVTGDAQIAGNAFQNLSGLSILNVNTGNNVAINASMNVNLSLSTQP